MENRKQYNVYKGYTIKYRPQSGMYAAFDTHGTHIESTNTLKELKENLDNKPKLNPMPKPKGRKEVDIKDPYMDCKITYDGKHYRAYNKFGVIAQSTTVSELEEYIYKYFYPRDMPMTKRKNVRLPNPSKHLETYKGYYIRKHTSDIGITHYMVEGSTTPFYDLDEAKTYISGLVGVRPQFTAAEIKRRKRKNISVAITGNPLHFPRTRAGRPRGRGRPKYTKPSPVFPTRKGKTPTTSWFILDIYKTSGKVTSIGQGTMVNAKLNADKISKQRGVTKCLLSGPYSRKPTKTTKRK